MTLSGDTAVMREYVPADMERFLHELYLPVLKDTERGGMQRYYICARGSFASTLKGDGQPIKDEWGAVCPGEFDAWTLRLKELLTRLPHCFNLTVSPRTKPDAKKQFTAGISALWCDIDGAMCGEWIPARLPKLLSTPFRPSAIIDSGWGTHLYWFLSSFIPFPASPLPTASIRSEVSFCNAFLAWYLGGDRQTSSVEHLMRLPGSVNCKTYPYRKTKIWLLRKEEDARRDYPSIRNAICQYKAKYEEWFTGEIKKGRDYSKALSELRGLYRASSDYTGSGSGARYGNRAAGDVKKIYEALRENKGGCPILDCAFRRPQELRYFEWISIGSALSHIYEEETGFEVFRLLSLPGNTSDTPEDEIRRYYSSVTRSGLMPYGCAKLSGAAGCPLFASGKCKSLLSCLRRIERGSVGRGSYTVVQKS